MDKLVNEGKRRRQRIVVGISGATGIIYGIRALLRYTRASDASRTWHRDSSRCIACWRDDEGI